MFTFKSLSSGKVVEYSLSIERNTHLLVVEQKNEGEEFPRYIRLTGQQVDKIKTMLFTGAFSSHTIPVNTFSLDDTHYTMCCREDNQCIRIKVEDMAHVYDYYNKHRDHIARYDAQFRSWR